MPTSPRVRDHARVRRHALCCVGVGALSLFAGACTNDGTIEIRGDVPGLDTLGLRGDSLLAAPTRESLVLDSLRAAADARLRSAIDSAARAGERDPRMESPPTSGAGMTARARVRGDSMARAEMGRIAAATQELRRANADTVRGVVTVVGSPAVPQVVLMAAGGQREVALSGMATSGLSKLVGLDVVVRGFLVSSRDVVVSDYIVRAAKGVPAFDGVLTQRDGGWLLVLTDGSGVKRVPGAPPTLRAAVGARVWVSMAAGASAPAAFGVVGR